MAYRQPGPTVWLYVVTSAAVIEFLQLFVYSRVTDTTSIITAAAGGLVGLWLAPGRQRRLAPHSHSRPPPAAIGLPMLWLGVLIWLVVVATVFWYPFDFNFDRAFVRDRLIALKQVPFNAYYFGSEFRAITEVIHKTGFMLPLGLLLGRIAHLSAARVPRGVWHAMATMLIVSVALGIEFGQLFLPTKNADLTDAFLEAAGGMLGYWGSLYVLALLQQPAHRTPP
jgi:VanZ family protein